MPTKSRRLDRVSFPNTGKRWSRNEILFLHNNWSIASVEEIAHRMGRSPDAIRLRSQVEGLTITPTEARLDSVDLTTAVELLKLAHGQGLLIHVKAGDLTFTVLGSGAHKKTWKSLNGTSQST